MVHCDNIIHDVRDPSTEAASILQPATKDWSGDRRCHNLARQLGHVREVAIANDHVQMRSFRRSLHKGCCRKALAAVDCCEEAKVDRAPPTLSS